MPGFVLLRSNGRLGNQLIELLGAISSFPDKKIIAIDFDAAYQYLDKAPVFWWVGSNSSYSFRARLFAKLLWLVRKLDLRLINFIFDLVEETSSNTLNTLPARFTLLNSCWINGPYFQNSQYLDLSLLSLFKPKEKLSMFATGFLNSCSHFCDCSPVKKVFLHIRLGDYLTYGSAPDQKSILAMPPEYYLKALKLILAILPLDSQIFVASDQIELAKQFLEEHHNFIYIDESAEKTLAILSQCDAGILSASSFSWWASHVALHSNNSSGPFLAPMYWFVHSHHEWVPYGFKSHMLTYIDFN